MNDAVTYIIADCHDGGKEGDSTNHDLSVKLTDCSRKMTTYSQSVALNMRFWYIEYRLTGKETKP